MQDLCDQRTALIVIGIFTGLAFVGLIVGFVLFYLKISKIR